MHAILAGIGIILAGWAGMNMLNSVAFGLLASGVVILSVGDYLFPVKYTLSEKCARSQCLWNIQEIGWDRVKRISINDSGILISPLAQSSRLDAFRGVYLSFDQDNREHILAIVKRYRDAVADSRAASASRVTEGQTL